jgi:serine phosphatase RsbU (regulator of sigma subunit)
MKQYFMSVFFLFMNRSGVKWFFYFIFIVIPIFQYSQNQLTDSLIKLAYKSPKDSAAKLFVKAASIFTSISSDSVRKYARIGASYASENTIAKGDALIQIGNSFQMENKIDSSLKYYDKALIYFNKIKNDKSIGKVYQSYAIVKRSLGDYEGSILESKKAFEIFDKINWSLGKVNVLNNIAMSIVSFGKYKEAEDYSRKAFLLSKSLGDSMKYITMMSELAGKFVFTGKEDSAIYYYKQAIPFLERNHINGILIAAFSNIGRIHLNAGNAKLAKTSILKAIEYTNLSGNKTNLNYLYRDLTYSSIIENNTDSIRHYFNLTLSTIDSINMQEGITLSQELEKKFETEKKDLQIKQQSSELELAATKSKQKNYFIYGGALVLGIVSLLGFLAFRNYLKVRKANRIIKTQNTKLGQSNIEITNQRNELEQKNTEIMQSIMYSKYLQTAILPKKEDIERISKVNFIKYQPKDIVSGDYYWTHNTPNGLSIWATMDCTGHGVPGAMMSMLGISLLNEIIIEKHIYKPSEILNRMRERIIFALNQNVNLELKDGMDGSICVWDKKTNTLSYASANSAVWVYRDNQFIELEYDKMPIGKHLVMDPFENFEFQLQKDDWVTSMSDGLVDQFGGPENKKLKYKRVREFLNEKLSMVNHEAILPDLQSFYQDWKGLNDQTDDVTVLGIKI